MEKRHYKLVWLQAMSFEDFADQEAFKKKLEDYNATFTAEDNDEESTTYEITLVIDSFDPNTSIVSHALNILGQFSDDADLVWGLYDDEDNRIITEEAFQ